MKEKTLRKITVFSILLCLFVGIFPLINVVGATSTEVTGLDTGTEFTGNIQHRSATVGTQTVYIFGGKILVYDSNNVLTANYQPETITGEWSSTVYAYNDTCVVYLETWSNSNGHAKMSAGIININTGVNQSKTISLSYPSNAIMRGGTQFYNPNNHLYYIYETWEVGSTGSKLCSYDPATNTLTQVFYSATVYGYGSMYAIPSQTETNIIYFLTSTSNSAPMRCSVYKMDLNSPAMTLIATTGIDNTWGSYVYCFGVSKDTCGSSTWYDVGMVYNNVAVNKDIYPQVIRFNDTSISYARSTLSASSAVNTLRCMNVFLTGIWNHETLLDGSWGFIYIGTSYGMMLCPFDISGLSTTTPSCNIAYSPSAYGDNGVQWVHHYTTANNVGGLICNTGISVQVDYQNGKLVSDRWASLNPSYSYIFSLAPFPIHIISSGTILRAVCLFNTAYNYTGEIFADGTRTGNGTYTVQSTGLSTQYNIDQVGVYGGASTTGVIVNGQLTFTLTPRTSAYNTIYEGIKVTITINGASQSFTHLFVWTNNLDEDGLQPSTAPTIPPNGGGSGTGMGGTNSINLLSGGTFIGLLITAMFALLFGAFAGRDGLLAGLMLGIMISSLIGLFPIYGILLSVVFGAILLLSHTSIGKGGGSDGE